MATHLHPMPPLTEQERAEKAHTASIRFKQQISGSVGGGMIFALVGVISTALLSPLAAGSIGLMPILGIAAVAAVGLGCVYMAAKFLSEAVSLDQDAQAKKFHEASVGKAVEPAPSITVETTKTTTLPPGASASQPDAAAEKQADTPQLTITNAAYQQKLQAPAVRERQ